MAVTLDEFSASLAESGLISKTELSAYLHRYSPVDADQLARGLIRQNLLTRFQAQQVMAGKARALVLGNYVILEKLGQGGMGMVLKARHRQMDRLVALKVLSPAIVKTPEALARFQREVQAAARLEHQNIVIAFDAGEANGTHFFVMQYVEGSDLASYVKTNGPLPVDQALNCILQAATGLDFAHQCGVIHRDIKPANLLLDQQGMVKILDMGLARIEGDTGTNAELTNTGVVMGTADYMAPEQAMDAKSADARSDIYSLGMTLWYLLTGRPAYSGDSLMARLMAHANTPVPSLKAACPEVPESLEVLFGRMVAKTPVARPQSMAEVITALIVCQREVMDFSHSADNSLLQQSRSVSRDGSSSGPAAKVAPASNPSVAAADSGNGPTVVVGNPEISTTPTTFIPSEKIQRKQRRKTVAWWADRRIQVSGAVVAVALIVVPVLLTSGSQTRELSDSAKNVLPAPPVKPAQADPDEQADAQPADSSAAIPSTSEPATTPDPPVQEPPAPTAEIDLLAKHAARSKEVLMIGNGTDSIGGHPHFFPDIDHGNFYTLTFELERVADSGPTDVFLIVAGNPCTLHLHRDDVGRKGLNSGLTLVDGVGLSSPDNPTVVNRRLIHSGKPFQLVCEVRPRRVIVSIDQQILFEWRGNPASLTPPPNQAQSVTRRGPQLGFIQYGGLLKCHQARLKRENAVDTIDIPAGSN